MRHHSTRYEAAKGAWWAITGKNEKQAPVAESIKTPACSD
jgi:hypothetical protein